MIPKDNPCARDCPRRGGGCAVSCEDYAKFREANAKRNAKKMMEKNVYAYQAEMGRKIVKNRNLIKK